MMKLFSFLMAVSLLIMSCSQDNSDDAQASQTAGNPDGFVRINATIQGFNPVQPWDRTAPVSRRGLGALLEGGKILTTSEMVANAVFLEIESADGNRKETVEVEMIDREANLALLKPISVGDESSFIEELTPLKVSAGVRVGDEVDAWQLEGNGQPVVTRAVVNSVEVSRTYGGGKSFFKYLLKASLQSSSNSFTLPIIKDNELVGVLMSYDSDEQISEVLGSEIIERFLEDAGDGNYSGFPSLGIAGTTMKDKAFREWLGLEDGDGGIYVTTVIPDTASEEAGLKIGDVILSIDGKKLDRQAYYDDEDYGKLAWTHLVRGKKRVGEEIKLGVLSDGERREVTATLQQSPPRLIPSEIPQTGNQYYVKGGVVMQQLTKKYLQAYGNDWTTRAPLNLMDVYLRPEKYQDKMDEAVLLGLVIPSQLTVGYERVINSFVEEVNGVKIRKMADLEKGFSEPKDGVHAIQISEAPYMIYLDARGCEVVDKSLLQQGIPALKRIYNN